jgi:acid phosphatase family membrane protein YuiD
LTVITEITQNRILWNSILAWFLAQILKVFLTLILDKRWDFTRFVGSGGMPSSHSAIMTCMATSIGMQEGFSSSIFALSVATTLVVMYDAAGVRRAAGKQAAVLNEIVKELQTQHTITEGKLKELLGHTPIEVIAGAVLGVLVAVI